MDGPDVQTVHYKLLIMSSNSQSENLKIEVSSQTDVEKHQPTLFNDKTIKNGSSVYEVSIEETASKPFYFQRINGKGFGYQIKHAQNPRYVKTILRGAFLRTNLDEEKLQLFEYFVRKFYYYGYKLNSTLCYFCGGLVRSQFTPSDNAYEFFSMTITSAIGYIRSLDCEIRMVRLVQSNSISFKLVKGSYVETVHELTCIDELRNWLKSKFFWASVLPGEFNKEFKILLRGLVF